MIPYILILSRKVIEMIISELGKIRQIGRDSRASPCTLKKIIAGQV
jgi:hypothetical protein